MIDFKKYQENLKLKIIDTQVYEKLSTEKLKVIKLFLGLDKESPFHNKMIGIIEYEDKTYRFVYNLIESKYMEQIDKIVTKQYTINGEKIDYNDFVETEFGVKAFWSDTSVNYLKEIGNAGDVALRELMDKIKNTNFGV